MCSVEKVEIDCLHNIENYSLPRFENQLNKAMIVPIGGLLPAIVKIGLGIMQTIISIAVTIFAAIPALCNGTARTLLKYSIAHIAHGLANIAGGIILGMPCLGTIILLGQKFTSHRDYHQREYGVFFPYRD